MNKFLLLILLASISYSLSANTSHYKINSSVYQQNTRDTVTSREDNKDSVQQFLPREIEGNISPAQTTSRSIQTQKVQKTLDTNLVAIIVTIILAIVTGFWVLISFITKLAKELYEKANQSAENANSKAENIEERLIQFIREDVEKKIKKNNKRYKKLSNRIKNHNQMIELHNKVHIVNAAKVTAMQQTLMLCLNKAPDRNKAFSIYGKLLSAYDILLHNGDVKYTPEFKEEMEMAATLIRGNRGFVPDATFKFIIKEQNLPFDINQILMGSE